MSVSCKDIVHGPWQKWRTAEDHMPGSIPASCGSVLAAHHYLVQTQSPTSVRDSGLIQSADLSQDPEQVICLLSYNEGVDKMIHTILY